MPHDRARKLAIYAREEVSHCWLIDPLAHTLEVLQLESDRWSILGTHGRRCARPTLQRGRDHASHALGRGLKAAAVSAHFGRLVLLKDLV